MNYNVNGIAFSKDQLTTIKLAEIKPHRISHAHLFYIPANGKNAFMVLRAGDYVEQEFIDKYTAKGIESFHSLVISSREEIMLYRSLFSDFKNSMNEKEKRISAQKIIKQFGMDYWQKTEKSYLAFTLSCFEQFNNLPSEIIQKYQQTSLTLYSRATLSASLSVIVCFINRIVDLKFIKDLYNLIFILDYGLIDAGDFTYSLSQACESERNSPGQGLDFLLKQARPQKEIDIFRSHPLLTPEFLEMIKAVFTNPEMVDIIAFHHEKSDGSGFPKGISYSGICDFETFQMFCDYIIPFSEHVFDRGDGVGLIKDNFDKLKNNMALSILPINKIMNKWEAAMNWAISNYIEEELNETEDLEGVA